MTKFLFRVGLCVAFAVGAYVPADDAITQPASNRRVAQAAAFERILKATVDIHTEKPPGPASVLFQAAGRPKINGMGTGVIVDERGYIVTNHHVIDGVQAIQVTLNDGTVYQASVFNSDKNTDLAIIKIAAPVGLPVMPVGTSSDLMVFEEVWAIGNAYGWKHTVTKGIISSIGRNVELNEEHTYQNLIQTDAAINPGNSGGPLVNADGDVIAINVAIRAGAQKIGFAIPIDDAREQIARLMSQKNTDVFHGLTTTDHKRGTDRKLVVRAVAPNSPAEQAGVKPGDVIVKVGHTSVVDSADLERTMLGRSVGEKLDLIFRQANETKTSALALMMNPRGVRSQQVIAAKPALPATASTASAETVPPAVDINKDKSWEVLGLRLSGVPSGASLLANQPYHGGLVVTEVRGGSPAETTGIKKGDVLVGLHVWETVKQEDVDYVLTSPDGKAVNPLKFYILRDGDTLFGHFSLGADPHVSRVTGP
ncbi:MAG: PDZ domain-containing protein [Planctomycetota bacterium]|nr:MAG: PDZ domain-containing protein [Planctomycetota bacterium]